MSPQGKKKFTPEQLTVAHEFIDAANVPIEYPFTDEVMETVGKFNKKLINLVRTAIEIAEEEPDPEEFQELRWVPVAKSMVRACLREKYGGSGGGENLSLFSDVEIEMQAELYAEAIRPDDLSSGA